MAEEMVIATDHKDPLDLKIAVKKIEKTWLLNGWCYFWEQKRRKGQANLIGLTIQKGISILGRRKMSKKLTADEAKCFWINNGDEAIDFSNQGL